MTYDHCPSGWFRSSRTSCFHNSSDCRHNISCSSRPWSSLGPWPSLQAPSFLETKRHQADLPTGVTSKRQEPSQRERFQRSNRQTYLEESALLVLCLRTLVKCFAFVRALFLGYASNSLESAQAEPLWTNWFGGCLGCSRSL